MRNLQFNSPKDALAVVVRRKWWVILTASVLGLSTGLVALLLPAMYVSESLILIELREIPDEFVKNLINADSDRRLDAIYQSLISRSNLLRVYNEFSHELVELERFNDEQRLEALRDAINVAWARLDRASPINHFRITYENKNPRLAQKVNARLTELFIKKDYETRQDSIYGTVNFFKAEVAKAKAATDASESELAQVKQRYLYELPEQQESNHRTLDRLYEQANANTQSIDRLRTERNNLERLLAETPRTLERQIGNRSSQTASAVSPLVPDYRRKELEYEQLRTQYTENHPDVRRLKAELDGLRQQIPPEDLIEQGPIHSSGVETTIEANPAYQKTESRLREVETEVRLAEATREKLQGQIGVYRSRIDAAPRLEQRLSQLQREYETQKNFYENLSQNLFEAEKAASLENKQKGEQFRVIDSASLPLSPAKPNRIKIVLIGILASLGVGVGLAIGRDLLEQRFHNYREVEDFFGAPILVEIPQILSDREISEGKRYRWATAAAFVILLGAGVGALLWIYTTPEVRTWGMEKISQIVSL